MVGLATTLRVLPLDPPYFLPARLPVNDRQECPSSYNVLTTTTVMSSWCG